MRTEMVGTQRLMAKDCRERSLRDFWVQDLLADQASETEDCFQVVVLLVESFVVEDLRDKSFAVAFRAGSCWLVVEVDTELEEYHTDSCSIPCLKKELD
jgi:hypothetical protein